MLPLGILQRSSPAASSYRVAQDYIHFRREHPPIMPRWDVSREGRGTVLYNQRRDATILTYIGRRWFQELHFSNKSFLYVCVSTTVSHTHKAIYCSWLSATLMLIAHKIIMPEVSRKDSNVWKWTNQFGPGPMNLFDDRLIPFRYSLGMSNPPWHP